MWCHMASHLLIRWQAAVRIFSLHLLLRLLLLSDLWCRLLCCRARSCSGGGLLAWGEESLLGPLLRAPAHDLNIKPGRSSDRMNTRKARFYISCTGLPSRWDLPKTQLATACNVIGRALKIMHAMACGHVVAGRRVA